MEPTVLGIVLDSSAVIAAERKKLEVADFIEEILQARGPVDLSLSPVTVAELVHGVFAPRLPRPRRAARPILKS
jgi:predicted nucleic acid-binding protein